MVCDDQTDDVGENIKNIEKCVPGSVYVGNREKAMS
jgi:hypothetical protein